MKNEKQRDFIKGYDELRDLSIRIRFVICTIVIILISIACLDGKVANISIPRGFWILSMLVLVSISFVSVVYWEVKVKSIILNCPHCDKQIDFHDVRFIHHKAKCPSCRAEIESLKKVDHKDFSNS